MRKEFGYDLTMKAEAMRYFLKQMKLRRDWHFLKVRPPAQPGVTFFDDGRLSVDSEALDRWAIEGIFYSEAYVLTVMSYFDILAKAFTTDWVQGKNLCFKDWIKNLFLENTSDPFLEILHNFKIKWIGPISNIRNPATHEKTLGRDVKSIFKLKWKEGELLEMRFLTVEIDGKEIEIIDFLERFQMEFDKLIEDAEKNYMNKEYMYFV